MAEAELQASILLVDDREANLVTLEAVLSGNRYRLVRAASGRQALSCLLKDEFAVIILDAQMPDMDGFETAALIRQGATTRYTPIIFVTAAYAEPRYVEMGYAAGAVDYLTKPFEPRALKSKVAIFVELWQKNKELQRKNDEIREQSELIEKEHAERIRSDALKEHYRSIMNGLDHSIIWEADPASLRFLFVSKRAEMLLGFPHRRWLEEPDFFFKRIPADERESVRQLFRRSIANGSDERCEHRMIASDGQTHWFHTGLQCERKVGLAEPALQGLTVDITPLKLTEQELRKREARYRRVIDANIIGHIFATTDGRIIEANDCFLQMTGYDREDLANGRMSTLDMTPPEYLVPTQEAIRELRETGVCEPYEKEYFRKDGTRIPIMVGGALLEGSRTELVSFILDLSERKKVEKEKDRALRAREEMLEIVSHDLRNPLGAILMNAVLMFKKIPSDQSQASLKRQVEMILRSAERMKRLIEDLLDLAKVEAGRLVLSVTEQFPVRLLEEVIEALNPLAEAKRIRIERHYDPDLPPIRCDRDRMEQALSNLLANAIKFTPEDGRIEVGVEMRQGAICLWIADNGIGINPDYLPHIFDRYWQGDEGRKLGTGLGLTIAKGIVEAHRGEISVSSQPGQGTRFQVRLPTER